MKKRLQAGGILFFSAILLDLSVSRLPHSSPAGGFSLSSTRPLAYLVPLSLAALFLFVRRWKTASLPENPTLGRSLLELMAAFLLLALATGFANLARAPLTERAAASYYLAALASIGAVALAAAREEGFSLAAERLLPRARAREGILLGLAAGAALVPLLAAVLVAAPSFFPEVVPGEASLSGRPELNLLFGLLPILALPLAEEYLFRARLLPALARRTGAAGAVALQALAFALLHFETGAFAPRLVAGLVLGILFVRSGTLWPAWAFHAFFNAGLHLAPDFAPRFLLYAAER